MERHILELAQVKASQAWTKSHHAAAEGPFLALFTLVGVRSRSIAVDIDGSRRCRRRSMSCWARPSAKWPRSSRTRSSRCRSALRWTALRGSEGLLRWLVALLVRQRHRHRAAFARTRRKGWFAQAKLAPSPSALLFGLMFCLLSDERFLPFVGFSRRIAAALCVRLFVSSGWLARGR